MVFCEAFEEGYDILTFVMGQQTNNNFVATCSKDDSEYHHKIIDLCG
jgi:hypothetical protein